MKKIIFLFALVMLISGCATKQGGLTVNKEATVNELQGQIYYTQTNIWFSDLDRGRSNDEHKGSVLSVGSKIKIIKNTGAKIKFSDESGIVYVMVREWGSHIDFETFFNRYFSKENVMAEGGRFSKFTKREQENIKRNTIDYDMSKEAVLMSYGYPPKQKHFISDAKSNQWRYLEESDRKISVYFKDNKIGKIEDIRPLRRWKPGKVSYKATVRENKIQPDILEQKDSNADEITKYKKLLDTGAITKEEYEQKKKQLLGL